MMAENDESNNIKIKKNIIRVYCYSGSILAVIVLALVLAYIYNRSLTTEYSKKIKQLFTSIISEKKKFLKNAVERTIFLIQHETNVVKKQYPLSRYGLERINKIVMNKVTPLIRNLRLVDNGYIWVNLIVNYDGGERYAIRKIHPNLPATEGTWLSTSMTDVKGNTPYLTELEGVKKNGDIFFDYYFKKFRTEDISHKLSYARLYKPFNWEVFIWMMWISL